MFQSVVQTVSWKITKKESFGQIPFVCLKFALDLFQDVFMWDYGHHKPSVHHSHSIPDFNYSAIHLNLHIHSSRDGSLIIFKTKNN